MNKMKLGMCVLCAVAASGYQGNAADVFMLPEVVVTATHTENSVQKVPAAMKIITQKDIKRSGAHDLRSLLMHETGIMLKTALRGGGHEVMVRGVDSDKTLLMVDGRRLVNEADSSGLGNKKGIERINVNEIERIEIVKGPSSALYGSDAIGGVINIITKKSKEKSLTMGAVRTETTGTNWYRFDTGRQGHISATVDMKFDKTFRYKTEEYDRSNSYGADQAYDVSVNYHFDEDNYINAYYNYYSRHGNADNGEPKKKVEDEKMPGMGDKKPGGTDMMKKMMKAWKQREAMAIKDYSDDYKKQTYGIGYYGKSDNRSWQMRIYGGTFDWYDDFYRQDVMKKMPRRLEDINDNHNKLTAVDGRTTITMNPTNRLTVGGEYTYNFVRGTNLGQKGQNKELYKELNIATAMEDKKYTKHSSEESVSTHALYVQDEITVGKFFLVPAVRYDHHSAFGGHTSWKWGMTYSANENLRVKMNYGDGFKAPALCQLYFDVRRTMGSQFVTVYGNPDLKPETSKNFDVALEMNKNQWYTSLGYFNNHIDNLIESEALDKPNHIYRFKNISKAHIQGIEHTLGYHINDRLEMRIASTWISAKDENSGQRLMQRPTMTQLYQLMYDDHKDNGFNATLWCERYKDFYYTTGNPMHPAISKTSYHIFGLTMSQGLFEGTRVFGTIENLFDKKDTHADLDGRFCTLGLEHRF